MRNYKRSKRPIGEILFDAINIMETPHKQSNFYLAAVAKQ